MTDIDYNRNRVEIDGESATVPGSIEDVVEINGIVVVLFEPKEIGENSRNVWGFDQGGKKQWIIDPAVMPTGKSYRYTGIEKNENELRVYNWKGGEYNINPNTGEIRDSTFTK